MDGKWECDEKAGFLHRFPLVSWNLVIASKSWPYQEDRKWKTLPFELKVDSQKLVCFLLLLVVLMILSRQVYTIFSVIQALQNQLQEFEIPSQRRKGTQFFLCVVQDELGLHFCCLLRFCWHQILCSLIITSLNSILLDENHMMKKLSNTYQVIHFASIFYLHHDVQ